MQAENFNFIDSLFSCRDNGGFLAELNSDLRIEAFTTLLMVMIMFMISMVIMMTLMIMMIVIDYGDYHDYHDDHDGDDGKGGVLAELNSDLRIEAFSTLLMVMMIF